MCETWTNCRENNLQKTKPHVSASPLNAMAWLASELARRERPLRAGDVVLSEAIGPMVPVNPGDAFEANVGGLRTVSARFA